jgi:hypothetical protein
MASKTGQTVATVGLVIFFLISVAMLIWALVNANKIRKTIQNGQANPYCIRTVCASGVEPENVPLKDDPQKTGFITLSYCVSNAPSTDFVRSLKTALADTNNTSAESVWYNGPSLTTGKTRIQAYKTWYNDTYRPRCGYKWADTPLVEGLEDLDVDEVRDLVDKFT